MVKKFTLPNGLRVVLAPTSGPAVTALILVGTGSEYEIARLNGISHYLEHMVFKGTHKRPRAGQISEELDSLGAAYNAFTGQEYTGYWAKAESRKLPELLELIADLYLNPIFDSKEIEKERGVIIEEINMYEDMPMRKVQEVFTELLYGDQPAGRSIAGKKELVARMRRGDFVKYRDTHYSPKNTVVVVAGKFSPKHVTKQIRTLFKKVPGRILPKKTGPKETQRAPAVSLAYKNSDQSHLVLGVRTFSMFDKRKPVLELLAHVLGGGMSSRLFRRIREELGAAYYVRASASTFLDHGSFEISAGVNHPKLEEVICAILEECSKLVDGPVPEDELRRVKEHLLGNFLLALETSDEVASFYGDQELLKRKMLTPAQVVAEIEAIKPEDIQKLAGQIFKDASLNLAVIGPLKDSKPLKAILHFP